MAGPAGGACAGARPWPPAAETQAVGFLHSLSQKQCFPSNSFIEFRFTQHTVHRVKRTFQWVLVYLHSCATIARIPEHPITPERHPALVSSHSPSALQPQLLLTQGGDSAPWGHGVVSGNISDCDGRGAARHPTAPRPAPAEAMRARCQRCRRHSPCSLPGSTEADPCPAGHSGLKQGSGSAAASSLPARSDLPTAGPP